MPNIFVFTAGNPEARQHLTSSIENPIADETVFASFPESQHEELAAIRQEGNGFYAWGTVPGERNGPTWEAMAYCDYVLCVYGSAYRYAARVLGKYENREFAREVWGKNTEGTTPQYMYFLTEPVEIYRPVDELARHLYSGYRGFTKISDEKIDTASKAHGSVQEFVDFIVRDDALSLMKEAAEGGISPNKARMLRRVNPEFAPAPDFVTDFVATYLGDDRPAKVLDAWANVGGWLPSLVGRWRPDVAVGLMRNPTERKVARLLGQDSTADLRLGDPLLLLDQITDPFDVVLGSPAWNLKPVQTLTISANGSSIEVRDYSSNLLLAKAANLLAPDGVGFFIVPSTFTRRRAGNAYASLEALGLYVDAVLEIPGGVMTQGRSQSGSLIIVRRTRPEYIFVGELSPDASSRNTLHKNLKARREGKIPQLGLLVEPRPYLSPQALFVEREVVSRGSGSGLPSVPLSDLATEVCFARPSHDFEDAPNTVYLPTVGRSPAVTTVGEIPTRHNNYAQIFLDPDKAVAGYVANFFNTSLGQRLRESLFMGSSVPRITKPQLERAPIYLPDLETQTEIMEIQTVITNLATRLDNYKRQLWEQPRKAPEIAKAIKPMNREDSLEEWIHTLPFPLASVLWAYRADQNHQNKRDHLFNLFEAISQFTATLMLSAFCSDGEFYAEESANWTKNDPGYERWFVHSTFGGWNRLGERLAKRTRTLLSGKETREKCMSLFGRPDAGFLDMLTSKKLFAVLREVEDKRNRWKGHGGILGFRELQEQVRLLEEYLSEIHQTVSDWYDNALVISPGPLEFEAGIYRHQVRLIKGPTTPFMQDTVESSSPMDKRHLYLLQRNQYQPVELLPLFRLMESPRTQQNACYFYNRLDGEENVRWVSYHFENEADISRPDSELRSALSWLEPGDSEAR